MTHTSMGLANWTVIVVYLLAMLAVGAYFTRRAGASTDAYFRAGGHVPAWAVGFSIFATTLSAITFMATPEQAFKEDWAYAAGKIAILAIVPLLVLFYIPFFRKLDVTSAYEYLEERFGPSVRVLGSLLFVLFHIGRVAIVVYLPTLAITSVSDVNPLLVASLVGVLAIVYTFLGGMEGIIWSDVIQGIILLIGAVLIIGYGLMALDGGMSQVLADAAADDKFLGAPNWSFDIAAASIPLIFLGSVFNSLQQYTASQDVVQRYQTVDSVRSAARSVWVNGWLAILAIPLFFGIGTVLYSYYKHVDTLPEGFNTSALVPYFVVTALPAGIAGLLIAAIFAAAQSTISSSLNSISACLTVDIRNRFAGDRGPAGVGFSRLMVIASGVLSVAVALYLVQTNADETWNLFLSIMGLFGVPLTGVFFLGIFTRRASTRGVLVGLLASAAIAWIVSETVATTPFHISTLAFVTSVGIGYLASLVLPERGHRDITALTIYGKNQTYARGDTSEPTRDLQPCGR